MSAVVSILAFLGGVLLFLLKVAGILLLLVLVLAALLLLCPFCADVCWEKGVLTVKAGALGVACPVFQDPKPEPPANPEPPKGIRGKLKAKFAAWRAERKQKKAAKKAARKPKREKQPATPRKKAKLTLHIVCTLLKGAGKLIRAVFGALRFTRIRVCLGVRGEDPAEAARAYGKLNGGLYTALGFLDRFVYLDFEELRLLPDFGSSEPTVEDRISFRVSARALFIVIAAGRVLYEFWREKVLDVFI